MRSRALREPPHPRWAGVCQYYTRTRAPRTCSTLFEHADRLTGRRAVQMWLVSESERKRYTQQSPTQHARVYIVCQIELYAMCACV